MPGAYDVLNKLKWTGKLKNCEIVILHRGAPGNKKIVSGKRLTELKKGWFLYKNREETLIPMHRVLEVRLENRVLWEKKQS